jgi:hypothetical protein
MKRSAVAATIVILLGAGLAVGQTATRWVERTKVDVRAGRGSFYDIVDTVVRGEAVQVLTSEARWQQVQTPRGKRGWVCEAALSASPAPAGGSELLRLAPGDASTSSTAASAGAKGVYAESFARQRGYDDGVVRFIESSPPAAHAVEAFVREGGLALLDPGR